MDIREIFEKYDVVNTLGKYQDSIFNNYIDIGRIFLNNKTKIEDSVFMEFLTGKGIASIDQTVSGLGKDGNGIPWKNETYSNAVKQNRAKIIEICNEKKFNKDWYQKLLDLFPTKKPNNITNRFLSTIFYHDLTTIVSWDELKGVLDFIGESEKLKGKRSDNVHWLELNNYLNTKIKETLQDLEVTTDVKDIIPNLGWKLVEFIREIKNNEADYVKKLLEHNHNVILTGAPGTGKTYLAKKIAEKIVSPIDVDTCPQIGFVQFHPSFDYTDFVEGLRPIQNGKEVGFKLKDGIFKEFCIKAVKHLKEKYDTEITNLHKEQPTDDEKIKAYKTAVEESDKYVFIIDEINRGEISKIFGELFFSIDPGYRGKDGKVRTQYANMVGEENDFDKLLEEKEYGHFFVPENVYIIGTMNDIDRSVESMDFAFRRRFAFYEVKATNHMLDNLEKIKSPDAIKLLKGMMTSINDKILEIGLTEAFQIGGAYFRKMENYYEDNLDTFNKTKFKSASTELWNYHLKGTLYEYFRGEPEAEKKMEELKKVYDNAIANG